MAVYMLRTMKFIMMTKMMSTIAAILSSALYIAV